MSEESKVTETPKVSADEPIIVNRRAEVENQVIAENNTFEESTQEESTDSTPEDKSSEKKPESERASEVERIKQNVQKRIDKVVAQKKSAEEELAEARAEIERLRNPEVKKVEQVPTQENKDLTVEQVEAWLIKQADDGTLTKSDEIKAMRLIVELEKKSAIKSIQDEQNKVRSESIAKAERENQALLDLAKDYVVYDDKGQVDMKSDMTLANQKGKLFEVAMSLYNDSELHNLYYNDPDRANGLRRAVADAYREIHQQGIIKTPKVDGLETRRVNRQVLADPDQVETDETPTPPSNLLSDADKVREEIKLRNKMRNARTPSRH